MPEAPLDLKWNIDLRLAPRTKKVPVELQGRPVASSSLVWTAEPEAGRPYLERALSMCSPDSLSAKLYRSSVYRLWRIPISRMAGVITPNPAILLISTTAPLIVWWKGFLPFPHQKLRLSLPIGDRRAPFIMNLLANWSDASSDVLKVSWIRGLFNKLRPAMKPGVYVNFMSGDEQDRVPEAYQERWGRMIAVKTQYDPHNFFRLNQNVPPRKRARGPVPLL